MFHSRSKKVRYACQTLSKKKRKDLCSEFGWPFCGYVGAVVSEDKELGNPADVITKAKYAEVNGKCLFSAIIHLITGATSSKLSMDVSKI